MAELKTQILASIMKVMVTGRIHELSLLVLLKEDKLKSIMMHKFCFEKAEKILANNQSGISEKMEVFLSKLFEIAKALINRFYFLPTYPFFREFFREFKDKMTLDEHLAYRKRKRAMWPQHPHVREANFDILATSDITLYQGKKSKQFEGPIAEIQQILTDIFEHNYDEITAELNGINDKKSRNMDAVKLQAKRFGKSKKNTKLVADLETTPISPTYGVGDEESFMQSMSTTNYSNVIFLLLAEWILPFTHGLFEDAIMDKIRNYELFDKMFLDLQPGKNERTMVRRLREFLRIVGIVDFTFMLDFENDQNNQDGALFPFEFSKDRILLV